LCEYISQRSSGKLGTDIWTIINIYCKLIDDLRFYKLSPEDIEILKANFSVSCIDHDYYSNKTYVSHLWINKNEIEGINSEEVVFCIDYKEDLSRFYDLRNISTNMEI